MTRIALAGTFDTKGREYEYLNEKLKEAGILTMRLDLSVMGEADYDLEYPADRIAEKGGVNRQVLQEKMDRKLAQRVMADGASEILLGLLKEGNLHGIVSMGGSQGVSMLSDIYKRLPIGFPKFMLSPLASLPGKMAMFQGINDTMTMNTIVDVAGLNSILKGALDTAAASIAAAARVYETRPKEQEKPVVGISMFGITTKCVSEIERILTEHGYEVLVFHANGAGGRSLEKMVEDGHISAVLDITPSEVGQHLLGGSCDAGEYRMEAMVERGIPYIVSAGAFDVVNFMVQDRIPEKYRGRHFHMHGLVAKVMRTSAAECEEIGKIVADRLNQTRVPEQIRVILPLKGISANDVPGNECFDPEADQALFLSMKQYLRPEITVKELDFHINDKEFARYAAGLLMEMYPIKEEK